MRVQHHCMIAELPATDQDGENTFAGTDMTWDVVECEDQYIEAFFAA